MSARDVVFIEVTLPGRNYALLHEWATRPVDGTKHGTNGGMQRRRQDWLARMDPTARSIRLTTPSSYERDTMDDVTWIQRQIMNRNGGGFQARIADIFEDTYPPFCGLPIRPKRR